MEEDEREKIEIKFELTLRFYQAYEWSLAGNLVEFSDKTRDNSI